MTYFGEFRTNLRALIAASIGLASGFTITNYTNNIFIPHLMQDFSWSSSQIALLGITLIISAACQPIAGHVTDRIGVRWMVLAGLIFSPIVYLGYGMMTGPFMQFFLLNVLQIVTVTTTTGPVVYTRLIAQRFDQARGTALAIATCSPALVGGLIAPFLSHFIDYNGWRAGYVALTICTTVGGVIALLLIPRDTSPRPKPAIRAPRTPTDYRAIVTSPVFHLIIAGMILCNLSLAMQVTQLKVVFVQIGIAPDSASLLISVYAAGVIVGRLCCGLALDRFPAHLVAAVSMGLPSIGLVMMATGVASPALLGVGVLTLGLSLGAEGDVAAYLVRKYFKLEVYSSVLGLVIGAIALSGGLGGLIFSATLAMSGSFIPFLVICAVSTVLGAVSFLLLGSMPVPRKAEALS